MIELLAIMPPKPEAERKSRPCATGTESKSVEGKKAAYKTMSMRARERNHAALRKIGKPSSSQTVAVSLGMSRTALHRQMYNDEALVRTPARNEHGQSVVLYWFKMESNDGTE